MIDLTLTRGKATLHMEGIDNSTPTTAHGRAVQGVIKESGDAALKVIAPAGVPLAL